MNRPAQILEFPQAARKRPALPSPQPEAQLLSVSGLSITGSAGDILVDDVSFTIPRGGTIGIVGESGSGKSLTCRAILGLLPPGLTRSAGTIHYRGIDLATLNQRGWRSLRGIELSAVFQDPASYLNPSIPVGTQLVEAIRATQKLDRRAARDRAVALLRRVGLADAEAVFHQYPFELSGGMAQRVLIAIAVSAGPQLLIADEATTALDVTVQAEVLHLLDELRREQGLTLILVSHDLAVVSQVCEHVIVMRQGVVVEAGTAADVLRAPSHPYTRSLIDSHHRYGVEAEEQAAATGVAIGTSVAPAPETPLLEIADLRAAYGNRAVLQGIDLRIDKGEILGLIGETGSGKTTILRSIMGLVRPDTGAIRFNGADISVLSGSALKDFRRSSQIQHAFQDPLRSLDPGHTVSTSIGEALDIRGGTSSAERARLVAQAMQAVGLDETLAHRLPHDLSGGQRQRVVIARSIVLDPAILLLDEPVSALDAVNRVHVLGLMRKLADERGIAQIFISHDLGSVAGITDRIAVLHQGQIVEAGPTRALIANPSHPYTRRLLASVPHLGGRAARRSDPAIITA